MSYQVVLKPAAQRQLKKLTPSIQKQPIALKKFSHLHKRCQIDLSDGRKKTFHFGDLFHVCRQIVCARNTDDVARNVKIYTMCALL